MPSRRRDINHERNREEIKEIAWRHLAAVGIQSFTLGAVARAMQMTTPALYRYYKSRDDLLDDLTRDAFLSFSQALENSLVTIPLPEHAERIRSLGLTYYRWASDHPQQYQLMFGASATHYPLEISTPGIADRGFLILLSEIDAADRDGKVTFSFDALNPPQALRSQLQSIRHPGSPYSETVVYLALVSWSLMHGITSLELNQRYALLLHDKTIDLIRIEIDRLIQTIGLS